MTIEKGYPHKRKRKVKRMYIDEAADDGINMTPELKFSITSQIDWRNEHSL